MTSADSTPASGRPTRAAFAFIFITVSLDFLAMGVTVPVLPGLIAELLGGDKTRAAQYYGVFATVFAAMQFLFAPVIGALSDRYGRRAVILLSTLGLGIDYFVMALAPTLGWLFLGRVVAGITSASYATAMAYVADVTPAERRAARFGMLGAAFGIGFILGPATGGLLAELGLRVPFWAAGTLSLLGTAYGWFVLPESLPPERRARFDPARANPLGALQLLRTKPALVGMGVAVFLYRLGHDVMPSTYVPYVDYRYAWTPRTVGTSLAFLGVASMVVQAGLIGPIVKRIGERTAMLVGFVIGTLTMLGFGLAPSGSWFISIMPLSAFFGLVFPSMQGLVTRMVGADEQGRLQGALASVMSIAAVLAPVLFTQTFAFGIARLGRPGSGAAFLLAGALLVPSAVIAARATGRDARVPAEVGS